MTFVLDIRMPHSDESESTIKNLNYRPHGSTRYDGPSVVVASTLVISFFILLAFVNAMCIVQLCRRKKLRPIDYLLINMSFSVIVYCCISSTIQANLIDLLPISPQAKCSLSNYSKYLLFSIISTSSFAISYERLISLDKIRRRTQHNISSIYKLIAFVWIVACGIILPTTMTSVSSSSLPPEILSELNSNTNSSTVPNCWRKPLYDSRFIDVWYEIVRYLFLHLSFTVSVFSELYMVRSKLKYICMSQTGSMRSKINRARCAFVQSVLFIVVWNIFGICNVIYTINSWYSEKSLDVINTTINIIKGVGFVYTIVNPILLFYSNQPENYSCCCLGSFSVVCSCFSNKPRPTDSNDLSLEDMNADVSRFSTRMNDTSASVPPAAPVPNETTCDI